MWGMQEQLQAAAVDALRMLVWSKTEDAQQGRWSTAPDPIPRPGVTPSAVAKSIGGDEEYGLDELRDLLAP